MKRILLFLMMMVSLSVMGQNTIVHIVQKGETLASIAKKYKTTVSDIRAGNPEAKSDIYPGMRLEIHAKGDNPQLTGNDGQTPYPSNNNTQSDQENESETNENNSVDDKSNTWHFTYRLGPAFYKTYKSGSLRDKGSTTRSSSTGFEIIIGAHYYVTNSLYLAAGLGYNQTTSSSSMNSIGSYSNSEVKSKNMMLPLDIGFVVPIIRNKLGIVLEGGVSLLYALGGHMKVGSEEISFSKMEKDYNMDIERFGTYARISAGIDAYGWRLMWFYGWPLSKKSINVVKDEKFWGITLGFEM